MPAHFLSWVCLLKGLLWDKHVTMGALGVKLIYLFQDYYSVPSVSVCKVYQEVFLREHCPSAYLHREPHLGKDILK